VSEDLFAVIPTDSDGGGLRFDSWKALQKWLATEEEVWSWLRPGDGITDQHNIASGVRNNFTDVVDQVRNMEAAGDPVSAASEELANFAPDGTLFTSESAGGATVLDILATTGPAAAAFAYGFLKRQVALSAVSNADQFKGALLAVAPQMLEPDRFSERLKREREAYRSANRDLSKRIEQQSVALDQRAIRVLKRARRIVRTAFSKEQESWTGSKKLWLDGAQNAVADIRSTESAYRESMKLQAPVEYWTNKAHLHSEKEKKATTRLQIFFPVALVTVVAAFGFAAWLVLSVAETRTGQPPAALYVVISGGLAVLVTMTFWIGRLFTKLYLSEHHLRNDAEERAVMTTTYLALTRESAAEETDRHIVLNALFRSSPDGIVKDDGPGDLTVQAMIAKAMTR
jgi:nitrate reductase NapE component